MAIGPHSRGWATALSQPVIGDDASASYLHQQHHLRDVSERMTIEHVMANTTTTDGQHRPGSAVTGSGAIGNKPVNRTAGGSAVSQDGPSQGAAGGNEVGRLYKITSGAGIGALMISDGTQWTDAVEAMQGDFTDNRVDLISGVKFMKASDTSSAMDLHVHTGRHTDLTNASANDHDYIPYLINSVVYKTPANVTVSGTGLAESGSVDLTSGDPHVINTTGRRSTSRAIVIYSSWMQVHDSAHDYRFTYLTTSDPSGNPATGKIAGSKRYTSSFGGEASRSQGHTCIVMVSNLAADTTHSIWAVASSQITSTWNDQAFMLIDLGVE